MCNPGAHHDPAVATEDSGASPDAVMQRIEASEKVLGEGMIIRRALPTRQRRIVAAWCFLDHFGPIELGGGPGVRVGPYPHTGLQTASWLIEGKVPHRDGLGFVQRIRPGQLNLMTAGRGLARAKESPIDRDWETCWEEGRRVITPAQASGGNAFGIRAIAPRSWQTSRPWCTASKSSRR
ncbi:MAG: pirin family protein [Burkholderiales bacterium]